MKVLFNAFAVLALIATTAYGQDEPTEPLKCEVTEPKPCEVWQVGETASTAWECETPNNRPLEKMGPLYLWHIELGRDDDGKFVYVDTLDASAKIRDLRFDWILKEYPPGNNYVVRMISTLKSTDFPDTHTEADKLDWTFIRPISIVAAGDKEGLESAKKRCEEEGGAKGGTKGGAKGGAKGGSKGHGDDRKDAKDNKDESDGSAKDGDKTKGSETEGNGTAGDGAAGNDSTGNGTGAQDGLGNSATSLLVGNLVLFAAGAIAGVLAL